MDQAEFNSKMQTVQEIEGQLGYRLLTLAEFRDPKTGRLAEVVWSHNGNTVFRQTHPLTDQARYAVYEDAYNRIIYSDFTK